MRGDHSVKLSELAGDLALAGKVEKAVPGLPFEGFCWAVCMAYGAAHMNGRVGECPMPTPADVANNLTAIAGAAGALMNSIIVADGSTLAALDLIGGDGGQNPWRLLPDLQRLKVAAYHAAEAAKGHASPGTTKAPLTLLIQRLADFLDENGKIPNAKPSGELHTLCNVALTIPAIKKATGDPKALRGSIASALKKWPCETTGGKAKALFRA